VRYSTDEERNLPLLWLVFPIAVLAALLSFDPAGQTLNPPPDDVLKSARPLQPAEIAPVLAAARIANR